MRVQNIAEQLTFKYVAESSFSNSLLLCFLKFFIISQENLWLRGKDYAYWSIDGLFNEPILLYMHDNSASNIFSTSLHRLQPNNLSYLMGRILLVSFYWGFIDKLNIHWLKRHQFFIG